MPLYEFKCKQCDERTDVFYKRIPDAIQPPSCPNAGEDGGHEMVQVMSMFARHLTGKDKVAEAEAKYGKEVDAAMGKEPDIGKYARRYEQLAKDLPSPNDL